MALKISRILHAGYVFEFDQFKIAFDPIFENPFSHNCFAFPDVRFDQNKIKELKFDAVFISHYHDDHCSLESLNLLHRETPIYLYCIFDEMFSLIKDLGFVNVHSLVINEAVGVGPFEVIPCRALDADVDSLFHIKVSDLNILNMVDSWIDDTTLHQLADRAHWDMVLWPFQTMREIEVIAPRRVAAASREIPYEWVEQLKALNPQYVVPSSCQFRFEDWSWYNQAFFPISYQQFYHELKTILPQTQVVRMNPGVSYTLEKNTLKLSESLAWMAPMGDQDVDYKYDRDVQPSMTSEIARRFSALSKEQTDRALDYCRQGLIQKFKSLPPPEDAYFSQPRIWQLSVYDHKGQELPFYYRIDGAHIEWLSDSLESVSWSTEISIAKLFAALENGESLTSLYIRINDRNFSEKIEKEIGLADIVEDPLIRCLFNGIFGAYQRAQLKQISIRHLSSV